MRIMAASKTKRNCCLVLAVPLVLLSLVCFAAVIGLGARGIELANDFNECNSASLPNNTLCENIGTLVNLAPEINSTVTATAGTVDPALQPVDEREYLYWLAGATGVGVIWTVINVFAMWAVVEVLVCFYEEEEEKKEQDKKTSGEEGHELQPVAKDGESPLTGGTDKPDSPDDIKVRIDTIGKYIVKEWQTTPLRSFDPLSLVGLFFCGLFFICSLLCLLWGVAISYDNGRRSQKTIEAYIIVELVTAVALPICLFMGAILLASVLEFITVGHLDGRKALRRFIPVVTFQEGEKNDYWVIEDTFYFSLKKKKDLLKHNCCYSLDSSPSTWFLTVIVCVSVHLAISYFVDITLDEQRTVGGCDDPSIDRSFDCFEPGTLDFVDCTGDVGNITTVHCFRFYRFGVDVDLVSSLSTAFAFYLATVATFASIFSAVKVILKIKPSRFWGIGFLLLGIIAIVVAIVTTVIWLNGYASDTVGELLRINVIHIAQFYMVAIYLLMVGLLLVVGKWWEKIKTKAHERPLPLPLIRYTDTTGKHISDLERTIEKEEKAHEASAGTHPVTKPTNVTVIN